VSATRAPARARRTTAGRLLRSRLNGVLRWLLPRFAIAISHLLFRTCRIRAVHAERIDRFFDAGRQVIFAGWHEGVIMLPFHFRQQRGGVVMVSASRDGDIIADVVARFGLRPVRGSSGRGGRTALEAMVAAVEELRVSAGIIVDGPRGPALVAKSGALVLARETGLPVVPGTWYARPFLRFDSWDHTILPLPFSRVVWAFEEPIFVPRDAGAATIEALRATLTERLGAARRRARSELGLEPDDG
jgi:lysophospholipid acyltransferase (LPLAT)-like uncharacterized protein